MACPFDLVTVAIKRFSELVHPGALILRARVFKRQVFTGDLETSIFLMSIPYRISQLPLLWAAPFQYAQVGQETRFDVLNHIKLHICLLLAEIAGKIFLGYKMSLFLLEHQDCDYFYLELINSVVWTIFFLFT